MATAEEFALEWASLVEAAEGTLTSLEAGTAAVGDLRSRLAQAAPFLPRHQAQRSQEELESLVRKLDAAKAEAAPKAKFGFKSRKKVGTSVPVPTTAAPARTTTTLDSAVTLENLRDEQRSLTDCQDKDVCLERLSGCTVVLGPSPSTIHIRDCSDCEVRSGPVSTSVFLERCTSLRVYLASQQLRIHSTRDSHFHLYTTAGPIIEDCTGLTFSRLPEDELVNAETRAAAGLTLPNSWDKVEDFNWLSTTAHSPNWTARE